MAWKTIFVTVQVKFFSLTCGHGTVTYMKEIRPLVGNGIDRVRQIYLDWQTENFVEYAEPELYYAAHRDEIQERDILLFHPDTLNL